MNERAQALAILKQARDMLNDRLTMRIVDAKAAILEDAAGLAYASELEAIYDQIGARLVHVNALLSNLPPEEQLPAEDPPMQPLLTMSPGDPVFVASTAAPHLESAESAVAENQASFQTFVQEIMANDVDRAGFTLGRLLGLEPTLAAKCAARFQERLTLEPDFLTKAMQLRQAVRSGGLGDVLMMLWECFGLQGFEAVTAYQSLQSRARTNEHG